MTNYEKFKEQIDLQTKAYRLAVKDSNNVPTTCTQLRCKDCKFYTTGEKCITQAIKWLKEEYIDTNSEIEVGDMVKIIDNSYSYTTYKNWVLNHISNKSDMLSYDINHLPTNGEIGTVIAKALHESNNKMLYYIKLNTDRCYLISQNGIKLYKED